MPFVTDELVVSRVDDENWALTNSLVYEGSTQVFTVPKGFVTDFASVPRIVVWLIPKFGRYTQAAILHDYLCMLGIVRGEVSSTDADGIFRRVMRELGVSAPRRWLMWAGVRWGAIFDAYRRPGWTETILPVLGISLLALPFLILPCIFVGITLLIFGLIELIFGNRRDGMNLST